MSLSSHYLGVSSRVQYKAIHHIENSQSVLVSAPTSAGKTAMYARYVIAISSKENQCLIYTTPFKALSKQKY